jgi:hypothetical protein
LRRSAADRPDAFLTEYAGQFDCTAAAVFYAREKLDIPRKKSFTYYEQSEERRAEYAAKIKKVPRRKREYVDESGVHIVGALCDGAYYAVECYQQTTDGAFFERWFSGCLFEAIPKGHTVIMDDAPFHRKKRLSKPARGKVRLLFLPPYSPDYNLIEKSWANMKRFLRYNLRDFQSVNSAVYDFFRFP